MFRARRFVVGSRTWKSRLLPVLGARLDRRGSFPHTRDRIYAPPSGAAVSFSVIDPSLDYRAPAFMEAAVRRQPEAASGVGSLFVLDAQSASCRWSTMPPISGPEPKPVVASSNKAVSWRGRGTAADSTSLASSAVTGVPRSRTCTGDLLDAVVDVSPPRRTGALYRAHMRSGHHVGKSSLPQQPRVKRSRVVHEYPHDGAASTGLDFRGRRLFLFDTAGIPARRLEWHEHYAMLLTAPLWAGRRRVLLDGPRASRRGHSHRRLALNLRDRGLVLAVTGDVETGRGMDRARSRRGHP